MSRYLVFDASNALHRTFFVHINSTEPDLIIGLTYHSTFMHLNKYFKQYKPDKIIMVFDRGNWRKEYTKSEKCYSKRVYKAHRKEVMVPKVKAIYPKFLSFVNDFEQLVREHTSMVCLAADGLEADDLIGGLTQVLPEAGHELIIISGDKDFIQLLRNDQIRLIDPATGKERTCEDPDYFIFEKCIRGDRGDNVQSAYPGIRTTRIKEAYEDPFKLTNLMNEEWSLEEDDGKQTFKVKKLFEENKHLMDLTAQPEDIRDKIFDTIAHEIVHPGKYSHFHFLRFLGKYQLNKLADQLEQFLPLLSK